jgi:hypothetical protein
MKRIVLAVVLVIPIVLAAPVRAQGTFDGAWKEKFVENGSTVTRSSGADVVCGYREKYFDATVRGNRFVAIIDQNGEKRKFSGSIGNDGRLSVWGRWRVSGNLTNMNVAGVFSGSRFVGRLYGETMVARNMLLLKVRHGGGSGGGGDTDIETCRADVYLARAPLSVDEVELAAKGGGQFPVGLAQELARLKAKIARERQAKIDRQRQADEIAKQKIARQRQATESAKQNLEAEQRRQLVELAMAEMARRRQADEIAKQKTQAEQKRRPQELARAAPGPNAPGFSETPLRLNFAKAPTRPDDIAVIIGNADYGKSGGSIPDATPAYADAASIKRYVTEALGIREGNIIYLKDASQSQFISVFGSKEDHKGKLFNWVMPGESRVFVFYSGHGAPGGADGSAYLVPSDADPATIELNGYSLDTLYRNLGKLPATSITVALEACFSGASQAGAVISNASPVFLKAKTPSIPPKITVIAAGAPNQMASWVQDKSNGLFTKYFLKGMSGEADASPYGNGDGTVAWDELERYFRRTLTYFARRFYGRDQTPSIVVGGGG